MRFEWVIGGVVLIGCALVLKKQREQGSFQCLISTFTLAWSLALAMHYWDYAVTTSALLPFGGLTPQTTVLIAFWLAFISGTIPSLLLLRFWIKKFSTTFPPIVDALIVALCPLVSAVAFFCLIFMSIAIQAQDPAQFDTRQIKFNADLAPVQAYVWLMGRISPEMGRVALEERLPQFVSHDFLRRYEEESPRRRRRNRDD